MSDLSSFFRTIFTCNILISLVYFSLRLFAFLSLYNESIWKQGPPIRLINIFLIQLINSRRKWNHSGRLHLVPRGPGVTQWNGPQPWSKWHMCPTTSVLCPSTALSFQCGVPAIECVSHQCSSCGGQVCSATKNMCSINVVSLHLCVLQCEVQLTMYLTKIVSNIKSGCPKPPG